ncbi:MAG: prolipoprotein diacylglyceryl transferase [Alphaproteobacteria bacterium CG_4_10_14_0_8_um_filter_37_21]|nr:MAG: prolipoprotein diacylglyceryl transferase [Alphaproteobacteria bacterium CG_4_10_14_0_8_um_filter_37_21]
MLFTFPNIDPIAFYIFSWPVRWYGISYFIAFITGLFLVKFYNTKYYSDSLQQIDNSHFDNMLTYGIIGIILGGRLGHMVFYDFDRMIQSPLSIFKTWEGGMAFHGGLAGCIVACYLYGKRHKISFNIVADLISLVVPVGLFFVRIANFINAELVGRITDSKWGVIFPGHVYPRHPSQLYEAFFEGIFLFSVLRLLFPYAVKFRLNGFIYGMFFIVYGVVRFMIEYVREPSDGEFTLLGQYVLSYGQILTLPMVVVGFSICLTTVYRRKS